MEKADSLPKQQAVDGKSVLAGNVEPTPEQADADVLATEAGVSIPAGEPVAVKAMLDDRDQNRWELNADSAPD